MVRPTNRNEPCKICGKAESRFTYGVHSCKNCVMFFYKGQHQVFKCPKNGKCAVLECPGCRMQKCQQVGMKRLCKICGDVAIAGTAYGVPSCSFCANLFETRKSYRCIKNKECEITVKSRSKCKYCCLQKCKRKGMRDRVQPTLCNVCGDKSRSAILGSNACGACQEFFMCNCEKEIHCKKGKSCEITIDTRKHCIPCRVKKCLDVGMKKPSKKYCQVCGSIACFAIDNVMVCRPCNRFFRTKKCSTSPMICLSGSQNCKIISDVRRDCSFCRYQKCIKLGMKTTTGVQESKSTPPSHSLDEKASDADVDSSQCQVCEGKGTRRIWGVRCCNGCRLFFDEHKKMKLVCGRNGNCVINSLTRTKCKACRLSKCVWEGMKQDQKGPDHQNRRRAARDKPLPILTDEQLNIGTYVGNDENSTFCLESDIMSVGGMEDAEMEYGCIEEYSSDMETDESPVGQYDENFHNRGQYNPPEYDEIDPYNNSNRDTYNGMDVSGSSQAEADVVLHSKKEPSSLKNHIDEEQEAIDTSNEPQTSDPSRFGAPSVPSKSSSERQKPHAIIADAFIKDSRGSSVDSAKAGIEAVTRAPVLVSIATQTEEIVLTPADDDDGPHASHEAPIANLKNSSEHQKHHDVTNTKELRKDLHKTADQSPKVGYESQGKAFSVDRESMNTSDESNNAGSHSASSFQMETLLEDQAGPSHSVLNIGSTETMKTLQEMRPEEIAKLFEIVSRGHCQHCNYNAFLERRRTLKTVAFKCDKSEMENTNRVYLRNVFYYYFTNNIEGFEKFRNLLPAPWRTSSENEFLLLKRNIFAIHTLWSLPAFVEEGFLLPDGKLIDMKGFEWIFHTNLEEVREITKSFQQLNLTDEELAILTLCVSCQPSVTEKYHPYSQEELDKINRLRDNYERALWHKLDNRSSGITRDHLEALIDRLNDFNRNFAEVIKSIRVQINEYMFPSYFYKLLGWPEKKQTTPAKK